MIARKPETFLEMTTEKKFGIYNIQIFIKLIKLYNDYNM